VGNAMCNNAIDNQQSPITTQSLKHQSDKLEK